jgi:hypothetical protein
MTLATCLMQIGLVLIKLLEEMLRAVKLAYDKCIATLKESKENDMDIKNSRISVPLFGPSAILSSLAEVLNDIKLLSPPNIEQFK